ncbi:hypothetical protein CPB84DRAFT_1964157 [Gymnopilus junonius]|uniref:F-box domain-containing protein n=1 Tax=Gymnopilus junonius TaxID=109634 RepID=A0A9P5TKV9_GYMJU|nr:hypothetical protein CPB84DRAFT_1964157 [Gymnopilus junonius]
MAKHHRGRFFIVDHLPIELSSAVFVECVSHQFISPFTLAAVSQRWREIAWTTPGIWTFLPIFVRKRLTPMRVDFIAEWLSRSGSLPLSILCNVFYPIDTNEDLSQMYRLIDIINRHSNHWYSLELSMPSSLLIRFNDTLNVSSTLHQLSLRPTIPDALGSTLSLSRIAPQVVLIRNGIQFDTRGLNFNCVTDLSMDYVPENRLTTILESTPNLRKCRFAIVEPSSPNQGPIIRISHARLESLQIEFLIPTSGEDFFNNVDLPNLQHLAVKRVEFDADALPYFLSRSAYRLKSFECNEEDFDSDDLIRVLKLMPSLELLIISQGDAEGGHLQDFYSALHAHLPPRTRTTHIPRLTAPLLPSLRAFKWSGKGSFPWGVIPSFLVPISARDSHPRPLENIQVSYEREEGQSIPYLSKKDITQLEKFRDKIKLSCTVLYRMDNGLFYEEDLLKLSQNRLVENKNLEEHK